MQDYNRTLLKLNNNGGKPTGPLNKSDLLRQTFVSVRQGLCWHSEYTTLCYQLLCCCC